MSTILSLMSGRPGRRALTPQTAAPLLLNGGTGEHLSTTRAMGLADVFACVRVLAESAASLPLHTYRPTEGGRERQRTGRLVSLIERPAPSVTTASLVGQMVGHLALHGNAYLGKYRDAGQIEQLGLLDPSTVTVKVASGAPAYEVAAAGGVKTYTPADVLHVRAPLSLDGVLGVSPIRMVRDSLTLADALGAQARNFSQNAARPSGILKVSGRPTTEQSQDLRRAFSRRAVGPDNAGNIAVLTGDVEWQPLSIPADDAQFVEQRQLSTAEVARIFRVPPWMIGAPAGDSLTYSNTEQQAAAFVTFSLRPWLVAIEQALSADTDLAPGALYVEFLLDALLRADHKTRADVYAIALDKDKGWLTRAEVRAMENLPPEAPGGVTP